MFPVDEVLEREVAVRAGREPGFPRVLRVDVLLKAQQAGGEQTENLLLAARLPQRLDLHEGTLGGGARAQDPDLALLGHHFGNLFPVAEEYVGDDLVGAGKFQVAKLTVQNFSSRHFNSGICIF